MARIANPRHISFFVIHRADLTTEALEALSS